MRCSRCEGQDDLVLIVRRVEALGKFLDTDDGKNLLAGYQARGQHPPHRGEEGQARLHRRARRRRSTARPRKRRSPAPSTSPRPRPTAAVAQEDFAAAMSAMAKLRPHVDAFFDKVTVNVDDKALRENRLKLLNEIREATRAVADFSKIEG